MTILSSYNFQNQSKNQQSHQNLKCVNLESRVRCKSMTVLFLERNGASMSPYRIANTLEVNRLLLVWSSLYFIRTTIKVWPTISLPWRNCKWILSPSRIMSCHQTADFIMKKSITQKQCLLWTLSNYVYS